MKDLKSRLALFGACVAGVIGMAAFAFSQASSDAVASTEPTSQGPQQASSSAMVVNGEDLYVLRGQKLFVLDRKTLAVKGSTEFVPEGLARPMKSVQPPVSVDQTEGATIQQYSAAP